MATDLHEPDPAVTREVFLESRSPRWGTANPERMNNPVWEWLVRSRIDAYHANRHFSGPPATSAGPGWCFARFGQSSTTLDDGRVVLVAGEHEDHYDPDFFIYNDVVVAHPDGRIDIFGYPREVFPPTDFHSATLVGNRLVLVGCLGYPGDRRPGETPVFVLDLEQLSVSGVSSQGTAPGWIHSHQARLCDGGASIVIERGQLVRGGPDESLVENIDDWQLSLGDWRWTRLTDRRWPRFEVRRSDRGPNRLWDLQQALWAERFPHIGAFRHPSAPSNNLQLFQRRYQPPLAHDVLPELDDEYGVHRIRLQGVVVRYVEKSHSVQMTVEGRLPPKTVDALARDLWDKLTELEGASCELVPL
ncbi:MAG: hypothetical protein HYZ29_31220 [Myxococcales bacterium]|nr:hypothetical protein [Myxococcales bacterium]